MALELRLLGPPAILVDRRPAPLRHRRAVVLLTLLALRARRPVERTILAETIWPERDPDEAAVNLRRALADLRETLGPEAESVVAPDRRTLCLDASCDALDFDDAARRFERHADPKDARAALAIYRGPLLEGWSDECVEPERNHRTEVAVRMAEALARLALDAEGPSEALRLLDQAETISPYRESTLRLRIHAHLAQGDAGAAQGAFAVFALRLKRDLGLTPSPETLRFAERLRSAPGSRPGTRPRLSGPLVGRGEDLARLRRETSAGGVVTVVGPGGVGKTRLALASVEGEAAGFVDLARLSPGASLEVIAEAIDVPGDPLVLDNVEHLLPAAALAVGALAGGERRILATSRAPLGVSGERLVRLAPLSALDAVRLFTERARVNGLDPATAERVCHRLDGLPLAIELAAARLRTLSLADLEARMDLDLLGGETVGAPERQRTVAGTVRWSVSLLSDATRSALARLAAFRGGFTLEAAETVLGTTAVERVAELVDRSLVLRDETAEPLRYRMLETVRTVASSEAEGTGQALGRWAGDFAERAYEGLWHGDPADWSRRLEEEWTNLRAGVEAGDATDATRIVEAIDAVWWRTGRFREGIEWREAARRRTEVAGDMAAAARHALSVEQFRRRLGEPNRARAAFRERADACLAAGDPRTASYLLHSLGFVERDDGDLVRAAATMREELALAERVGEPGLVAYAWRGIAVVDLAAGRTSEAVEGLQRSVAQFGSERLRVQQATSSAWLGEALLGNDDAEGAAAVAEIAVAEAREQGLGAFERGAELIAVRAALELGSLERAARGLDRASSLTGHHAPEDDAEIAVVQSALVRAQDAPDPHHVLGALRAPAAANLPYPTLLRVVEEAARTLEAIGFPGSARRLEAEAVSAREAAGVGAWSAGLTVTRALAAFPSETIRAA